MKRLLVAIAICVVVGATAAWATSRSVLEFPTARITLETGGGDRTIAFEVRNREGHPVSGIRVNSDSSSGWARGETTNDDGRAVLSPGENDVPAIEIDGIVYPLCNAPQVLDLLLTPSCRSGLNITVVLLDR